MTEIKKEWVKPELIILWRCTPEEAVLTYCKAGPKTGGATGGVNNLNTGCGKGTTSCASPCSANKRS